MAKTGIEEKVAALGELSRDQLTERWKKRFGCSPPSGVRMPLLVRAAAWQEQERALGGFSTSTKRLLKAALKQAEEKFGQGKEKIAAVLDVPDHRFSADDDAPSPVQSPSPRSALRSVPLPGTRLIREWNGKRYTVDVVADGYLMDEEHFRSLTAIAYAITGARWSGPRFFGL